MQSEDSSEVFKLVTIPKGDSTISSPLRWGNDCIQLEFEVGNDQPVALVSMTFSPCHEAYSSIPQSVGSSSSLVSADPAESKTQRITFLGRLPMVQIEASGRGTGHTICGRRLIETSLGQALRFASWKTWHTNGVSNLEIRQKSQEHGIECSQLFQVADGDLMFKVTTSIKNTLEDDLVLESLPTYCQLFGQTNDLDESKDRLAGWQLAECRNDWLGEGRWSWRPLREICPLLKNDMVGRTPQGAYSCISEGTFSTGQALPMSVLASPKQGITWLFQIEHNGPWRWEVGEGEKSEGYFALSGPTYKNHNWSVVLHKEEQFTSVPVSVTPASNFDQAVESVANYRRHWHLATDKLKTPEIIFNDYMNTLNGDPSTDRLLPLIKAAGSMGAEVFCIDAGWYDDTGDWWPSVGEWKPSTTRFPGGLGEVMDAIKREHMIPGLWLEPEVVGVKSPLAKKLPDSAFFQHAGHRVVEQNRYLLDFRNPQTIRHMNEVIDRLVGDFGVGYFKFDYNVMPGPGTTYHADSPGEGLLGHNRAYREWIKGLYRRHPNLILENCSSGGMRTDFAQSSVFHLLSTSDQQDFGRYASISATAPMAMLPEQAGNWAYPAADMDDESFCFALTNTLLGHFFLSGYLNRFSEHQLKMVRDAIDVYRRIIGGRVATGVPFWPLGLPGWYDDKLALGIRSARDQGADGVRDGVLITVWARCTSDGHLDLPLPMFTNKDCRVQVLYPCFADRDGKSDSWRYVWHKERGSLEVHMPEEGYTARTLLIRE